MKIEDYLEKEGLVQRDWDDCEKIIAERVSKDNFKDFEDILELLGRLKDKTSEQTFYNFIAFHDLNDLINCVRYAEFKKTLPAILEEISDCKNILDVGCGDGIATVFYALNLPESEITAVDINSLQQHRAEKRAKKYSLSIKFESEDLKQLPYQNQFDAAIASCVMHESAEMLGCSRHGQIKKEFLDEKMGSLSRSVNDSGRVVVLANPYEELLGDYAEIMTDAATKLNLYSKKIAKIPVRKNGDKHVFLLLVYEK